MTAKEKHEALCRRVGMLELDQLQLQRSLHHSELLLSLAIGENERLERLVDSTLGRLQEEHGKTIWNRFCEFRMPF